jgi:hypothetical protein
LHALRSARMAERYCKRSKSLVARESVTKQSVELASHVDTRAARWTHMGDVGAARILALASPSRHFARTVCAAIANVCPLIDSQ